MGCGASRIAPYTSGQLHGGSIDTLVISGLSGRLPESSNMKELWENLISGVDMVTEDDRRWPTGVLGVPSRSGKLKEICKFDAEFFNVTPTHVNAMDPAMRILKEVIFETIVDSGHNPADLSGTKTGVFVGQMSDPQGMFTHDDALTGHEATGTSRSIMANRMSYAFNFHGPSLNIDTACSSSLEALCNAVEAIRSGRCDRALVCGVNLLLEPLLSHLINKLGALAPDGKCRSFDRDGKGYVRSEGVVAILVQKQSECKRQYLFINDVLDNADGYTKQGLTYPSAEQQTSLISTVYERTGVDPQAVTYVETHGTGTPVGDPQEMKALTTVMCGPKRTQPLQVGSTKSNLGHTEATAGLAGLSKVILASEKGKIPPNLHYENPNPNIPSLHNGTALVITEPTPLPGNSIIGISSYGFGGANVHAVLTTPPKGKSGYQKNSQLNSLKLFVCSGRTLECIDELLSLVHDNRYDNALLALIMEGLTNLPITKYPARGYYDLEAEKQEMQMCSYIERPVWFIFPGMGSQWLGMAHDVLQENKTFADAVCQCHKALQQYKYDLLTMLKSTTESSMKDPQNAFIGITAIQIGLVEVLRSYGIHASGMVGHSLGELACAYVDGGLTIEQTMQVAYLRGQCIKHAKLKQGKMAAVGISWEDAQTLCSKYDDVVAACHNGQQSVTISGTLSGVSAATQELSSSDIFTRDIDTSGVAFHSFVLEPCREHFLKGLKKIIPVPVERSDKWLSTSIDEDNWDSDMAAHCSAEYHVNNFLSPVLFHDAVMKIPKNALIIEIGPAGLFQSILRKSVGPDCVVISMMAKPRSNQSVNNVSFIQQAIGKCYMNGINLPKANLYTDDCFPVPKGTPMISPAIRWNHTENWKEFEYRRHDAEHSVHFDLDNEDAYLKDHCVNGRVLLPGAALIVLAWQALAYKKQVDYEQLPIYIKELHIVNPSLLKETGIARYPTVIMKSGKFEISDKNTILAEGTISELKGNPIVSFDDCNLDDQVLTAADIYPNLSTRGYEYGPEFQQLVSFSSDGGNNGELNWNGKYITLIDCLTHQSLLFSVLDGFAYPTAYHDIRIIPEQLKDQVGQRIPCKVDTTNGKLSCPGVEIGKVDITFTGLSEQHAKPTCQNYFFCDYETKCRRCRMKNIEKSLDHCLRENFKFCLDTIFSNVNKPTLSLVGISQESSNAAKFLELLDNSSTFGTKVKVTIYAKEIDSNETVQTQILPYDEKDKEMQVAITKADIFLIDKQVACHFPFICSHIDPKCHILYFALDHIALGDNNGNYNLVKQYTLIQSIQCTHMSLFLYRKPIATEDHVIVKVDDNDDFKWVNSLQESLNMTENNPHKRVWVMAVRKSGIIGLVNTLRKEPGGAQLRCVYIMDGQMEGIEDEESDLWKSLREKDVTMNVFKNGQRGSFFFELHTLSLKEEAIKKRRAINLVEGDPTTLTWVPDKNAYTNSCEVHYVGLTSWDYKRAIGYRRLGQHDSCNMQFGKEFSGLDKSGKRVFGISKDKCLSTSCESGQVLPVPNNWKPEDAAAIFLPYCVAYYAIEVLAKLEPKTVVIIIGSETWIGKACINVAKQYGATVLTPHYQDNNIFTSADPCLLINCTDDEVSPSRLIGLKGHYIRIETDTPNENKRKGCPFGITSQSINVHELLEYPSDSMLWQNLAKLLRNGIEGHYVKPLPMSVFDSSKLTAAFQSVSKVNDKRIVIDVKNAVEQPKATIRTNFDPTKVYIITGGLGGLGLEMCQWMIQRGARNLAITSRSGVRNGYQQWKLDRFKTLGAYVHVLTHDVSDIEGAKQLLSGCRTKGKIGGIFHLAAVLQDGFFSSESPESLKKVCKVKINGTKHLDNLTREMDHLDWFVVFSSFAAGYGNPGQSNYAYANSYMERVVEKRDDDNVQGKSKAIQWGLMGDVGIVQRELSGNKQYSQGTVPQRVPSFLSTLDGLLQADGVVYSSVVYASGNDGSYEDRAGLFDEKMKILGWTDNKATEDVTFENFGLDSQTHARLQQLLARKYNIRISAEELIAMTPKKLKQLQDEQ